MGSALPGPAQAVARGAGVVGVAYASLWLLLLGYRTVKKQLLRKALREIVPALEKVRMSYLHGGGGGGGGGGGEEEEEEEEEKAAACCITTLCVLRSGCARVPWLHRAFLRAQCRDRLLHSYVYGGLTLVWDEERHGELPRREG